MNIKNIKIYPFILLTTLFNTISLNVFGDTQTQAHTLPLINNTQANAFALSAPTGLMVQTTPSTLMTSHPMGLMPHSFQGHTLPFQNQLPNYQNLLNRNPGTNSLLLEQIGQEGLRTSTHQMTQDSFKMAQNLRQSKSAFPAAKGTAGEVVKKQGPKTLKGKASPSTPTGMKHIHQESLYAGIVGAALGGGIEIFSQLSSNQAFDWQRFGNITLLNGASGYTGTLGGALVQKSLLNNQTQLLSKLLNTKVSASILGGFSAGTLASALFAYGTYFLGYADLKTAHRSMIAGTLGASVFSVGNTMIQLLFSKGITVTTIGATTTASSSGLMGTLSATGVGLVALAALGVGTGTLYLFHLADKKAEHQRIEHLMTQMQKNFK
jgi:hypothetical protein